MVSASLIRRWHDRQTAYTDMRAMLGAHSHHAEHFTEQLSEQLQLGSEHAEAAHAHMIRLEQTEAVLQSLQDDLGLGSVVEGAAVAGACELKAAVTVQVHFHNWRARQLVRTVVQASADKAAGVEAAAAACYEARLAAEEVVAAVVHEAERAGRTTEHEMQLAIEQVVAGLVHEVDRAGQVAEHEAAAAAAAATFAVEKAGLEQRAAEMEASLAALRAEQVAALAAHAAELAGLHAAAAAKAEAEAVAEAVAAKQNAAAKRIQSWWRQRRWMETIRMMLARKREAEAAAAAEQARVRAELEAATAKVRAESEVLLRVAEEEAAALKQVGEQRAAQAAELSSRLDAEVKQREEFVLQVKQEEEAVAAEVAEEVRQLVESGGPPPGADAMDALAWAAEQNPMELLSVEHAAAWLGLLRDCEFDGWLSKRGARGIKKGWKRRWFMLGPGYTLEYFTTAEHTDKKGQVDLSGCLKVRPAEGGRERPFEIELVCENTANPSRAYVTIFSTAVEC